MTRTTRNTIVTLQTLIAAGWFTAVGCSSTNEPAVAAGGSPTTGAGGTAGAGTGGTGGATGGTAGTTGGTAGASGGTGGVMGSTTGGTGGGVMTGGTGGANGGVMGGGTGGSAATDGGTGTYSPVCGNNSAGVEIAKGVACTDTDPQLCWKKCGPLGAGFKKETCTLGLYAEESGATCYYPPGDYACYKVPAVPDATCPTTPPQATKDCTVATCTPCSASDGMYLESGGGAKPGYCVCPAAGASGSRKWSCASTSAWPCPSNDGCR